MRRSAKRSQRGPNGAKRLGSAAIAGRDSTIVERLKRRTMGAGSFSGPCLPALFEHYALKLARLFEILDRPLEGAELAKFRELFQQKLGEGFAATPYARFVFAYRPLESNPQAISCEISVVTPSLDEQYDEWLEALGSSEPFGSRADAKVVDVARSIAEQGPHSVLDAGAGSGRNALVLARMGHAVDALEPVTRLAGALAESAAAERLSLKVIQEDLLSPDIELDAGRYGLIVLSEVAPHLAAAELKLVFEKLGPALAPGGTLLLNAFVAHDDYRPTELARQAAQSVWSTFFTSRELAELAAGAGLELIAREHVVDYESRHLPAEAWPPTPWFVNWATGRNLFTSGAGAAPIELFWLTYRIRAAS